MHPFVDFPVWVTAIAVAWMTIGVGVYLGLCRRVSTGHAKVGVKEFDVSDLFVLSVFVLWFGATIALGFTSKPKAISQTELLNGSCLYIGVVLVIGFFLRLRGIRPWRQFGLEGRNPALCLAMALGLLFAAYPLMGGAALFAQHFLHNPTEQQPLVEFFRDAAQRGDRANVLLTMLVGVLVAPVAEETIFRGYIYGVLKRYCGGPVAVLAASALFAAMHVNAPSLAPLFTLALCLTAAYEVTGSLFVNIFMHAMFNLFTFLVLLDSAHRFPNL